MPRAPVHKSGPCLCLYRAGGRFAASVWKSIRNMPPSLPSRCWTQRGSLVSDPQRPHLCKKGGGLFLCPQRHGKTTAERTLCKQMAAADSPAHRESSQIPGNLQKFRLPCSPVIPTCTKAGRNLHQSLQTFCIVLAFFGQVCHNELVGNVSVNDTERCRPRRGRT